MPVIFSRKRNLVKRHLKHTGRGVFLGSLLVILGIALLPFWLNQVNLKEKKLEWERSRINFSDLLRIAADEAPQITERTFFSLQIPKIGVEARVIPNVNSADKFEYSQALSRGVAHAAGTFLPGMDGAVTLFAHSTDISAHVETYNAVFYRLDELNPGDLVTIWYLGKKYDYRVTGAEVVRPENVEVFKTVSGQEKLFLVTCTPRGTTEKRLIVEAIRI